MKTTTNDLLVRKRAEEREISARATVQVRAEIFELEQRARLEKFVAVRDRDGIARAIAAAIGETARISALLTIQYGCNVDFSIEDGISAVQIKDPEDERQSLTGNCWFYYRSRPNQDLNPDGPRQALELAGRILDREQTRFALAMAAAQMGTP